MPHKQQRGFTIVELLIVIVIIAILAAITVVVYNGVQARAVKTALQSDLRNAATKIDLAKAESGSYPTDSGQALALFTPSAGTDYQYTSDGSTYYLTIRSNKAGIPAYCKSSTNSIVEGPCPGHSGPIADGGEGESSGNVTTLAGSGEYDDIDGVGTNAAFSSMQGITIDSSGVVYVAGWDSHKIRKIMPNGTVSTLAEIPGLAKDIAVDSNGYVYVTDQDTHSILKITPSGTVSTLAGPGTWNPGYADGTGTAARFNYPSGIAVDAQGYLYVADWNNQRIRKISPAGVVTTLAGSSQWGNVDGTGSSARFSAPNDVAIDASGNLYVTETGSIRKVTPAGVVTTVSNTTSFNSHGSPIRPQAVAVDSEGNIYFEEYFEDDDPEDISLSRIMRRDSSGTVTPVAGSSLGFADGAGTNAQFSNGIFGITVSSSGTIYVADGYNNRVRKIE